MIGKLIAWGYARGYELTFGHAWRDEETQRRMVERGLSRTMDSKHLSRLAVDFNLFIDGEYIDTWQQYAPLGKHWESMGGIWGGRWETLRDANHFEYGNAMYEEYKKYMGRE